MGRLLVLILEIEIENLINEGDNMPVDHYIMCMVQYRELQALTNEPS